VRVPGVDADIERVVAIWADCLQRSGGPFPFGNFTLADAMYAPVAARLISYAVALETRVQANVDHLWNLPSRLAWCCAAVAETEFIAEDEPYR